MTPNPLFNQRNQKVGQQINIAGNAHLNVKSPIPSTGASVQSHPPTQQRRAPKKQDAAGRAKAKSPTRTAAQSTEPAWIEGALPDWLYVVFCRICGIKEMTVDLLAGAQQALDDACTTAQSDAALQVRCVRSSVYGRFLCVPNSVPALNTAIRVLDDSARKGVHLAIGVAVGKLNKVKDWGQKNLIGQPINMAARLAAMDTADCKIAITEDVYTLVTQNTAFPKHRFIGPMEGQVKRTVLQYRILSHTTAALGPLAPVQSHRSFDANVLVYDIVRFSEQPLDEQERLFSSLRAKVDRILVEMKLESRVQNHQLWYAPAGDGGVLVFSPEEGGGDIAWRFTRRLAQVCDPEIEIRLGVSIGSVVVVGDNLPVGSGIMLADQLSSYPQAWQVCVNRAFWNGRSDNDRKQWVATAVEEGKDAFLLKPKGTEAEIRDTAKPYDQEARAIFHEVVTKVERTLKNNPKIQADLEEAVRQRHPEIKAKADLIDMLIAIGLNALLESIYHWLDEETARHDARPIALVVDGLVTMGVKPQWVKESRAKLTSAKGELTGGIIPVPRTTEMSTAEIIKAAILNEISYWGRPGQEPPAGDRGFDASGPIEPPSPTLRKRLDEFRKFLYAQCHIQTSDPDGARKLQQHLAAWWQQKKPIYALFGIADDLAEALKQDPELPGQFLLFLQKSAQDDVLSEPRTTAVWLKDIHKQLQRLEQNHP